MKTQLNLVELATKISEDQKAKEDCVAASSVLEMKDEGPQGLKLNIGGGIDRSFGILDTAHRQLAGRLNIPAKYYDRMRSDSPELLADNVNHWLHRDGDTKRLIRTMRGDARAVLSERYRPVEHEQIAEVVLPILQEMPGLRFESLAITESRLYIKAVTDRISGEVAVGDTVQIGVSISNSEIGAGAVVVQPLVYRLVCLNGMTVNDAKFRANHIGARLSADDQITHMLSDEAIEADSRAIILKVRDVLKATMTQDFLDGQITRMRAAKLDMIEGDVPAAIDTLAKMVNLTQQESSGVLRHLIDGADRSRYGLLNAVTRYSQDVESYDRATELEAIGGQVLNLPSRAWREISRAAA